MESERRRGRPKVRYDYRQVHIYMPPELVAVLDELTAKKSVSRNALIVQLLSKATKVRKAKAKGE